MGGAGTLAGVLGVRGTLAVFSAMRAVLMGRPERKIGSARIVWCAAGPSPIARAQHFRPLHHRCATGSLIRPLLCPLYRLAYSMITCTRSRCFALLCAAAWY